jgi:hypothetical protein
MGRKGLCDCCDKGSQKAKMGKKYSPGDRKSFYHENFREAKIEDDAGHLWVRLLPLIPSGEQANLKI